MHIMNDRSNDAWYGLFAFAATGAACFGWRGAIVGAVSGYLVGRSRSRMTIPAHKMSLQNSAAEARRDELRLVTNYLHASGIPAWREAARELSDLSHRNDDSGPA